MKSIFAASTAVLLVVGFLLSLPASAQINSQTAPQGSYSGSCKSARMLQGVLVAFCDEGNGNWHMATLAQAARCTGDIQNLNGRLVCGAGPQVGSSTAPQNCNSSSGASEGQAPIGK